MTQPFVHKKSLGQNFLNSDYVPKKMCDAALVGEGDVVLEIGPGTGALTKELLARGTQVIALEADPRAMASLEETFAGAIARGQLTLHHHDAHTFHAADFGVTAGQFKIVANIPYYLSGLLLRQALDTDCQPNTLVFLMQKELVERIARSEKESLLSLSVKAFGDPTYICTIKRSHFTPPPKVDSAILKVANIGHDNFKHIDKQAFFELLHLGFGSKRKQLVGNLARSYPREQTAAALTTLALPIASRAEDLTISQWLHLSRALN